MPHVFDSQSKNRVVVNFLVPACVCLILVLACGNPNSKPEAGGGKNDSLSKTTVKTERNCSALFAEAYKMDSLLLQATEPDQGVANKAIKAFTDFAYYCNTDSLSPVYLIKAAQVARAINNIPQAKIALDYCIDNFQGFRDRPAAMFLLAQLYDEPVYLNDEAEARKLYQKIVDEYPKSAWAASAQGAIKFLGKSDAELLKELKKRNK